MRALIVTLGSATMLAAIVYFLRLPALIAAAGADGPSVAVASFRIAYSAYAIIASGSAMVIALRAWRTREARLLTWYLVFAGCTFNVFAMHAVASGRFNGYVPGVALVASTASALGIAALLHFSAVIAGISTRSMPPMRTGALSDVVFRVAMWTGHGGRLWAAGAALAVLFALGIVPFSLLSGILIAAATAVLMLTLLTAGFRAGDAERRNRIRWVIAAVVAGGAILIIDAALLLMYRATGIELPILGWDAWLLILGCLTALLLIMAAVFYHGAIDPALVIRRSLLAAVAGPLAVFMYAGVEEAMTSYVATRLRLDPRYGSWMTAGLFAVLVTVLRPRVSAYLKKAPRKASEDPLPNTSAREADQPEQGP